MLLCWVNLIYIGTLSLLWGISHHVLVASVYSNLFILPTYSKGHILNIICCSGVTPLTCIAPDLPTSDLKLASFDVSLILSKSNSFPSVSYHNITPVSCGIDRQFIYSMNWCLTTIMTTQSSANFCSTENSDCVFHVLCSLVHPEITLKVTAWNTFAQRLVWGYVTHKSATIRMFSLLPNLNIMQF